MYAPDYIQIFEDTDYSDACENVHCQHIALVGKHNHPVCDAGRIADCPRVALVADEINQFIKDNKDILRYLEFTEKKT